MNANTALLLLGGLVVLTALLGLLIRRTQTRVRRIGVRENGDQAVRPEILAGAGEPLPHFGDRLTAVQFSSETCARCPATARVLSSAIAAHDGAAHVEIDITHRDDLIARFGLLRTPTVLLLDGGGVPLARVSGPIDLARASELLEEHLAEPGADPAMPVASPAPAAFPTLPERSSA